MRVERVECATDPRIEAYRDVTDASLRDRAGLFLVEGRRLVRRLVAGTRFPTRSVFVTPTAHEALRDALSGLPRETPVYVADQTVLNRVVGYNLHQGCLAAAERPADLEVSWLLPDRVAGGVALLAEQVANPDNVGALFRNAMAFGVRGVVLCPRCADPLYRKAVRVSMGGALEVPFARSRDLPRDLRRLRERGWRVVALDPRGDSMEVGELADRLATDQPTALLLGAEGTGLSRASLEAADWRARIDMAPGVDSLNVATAAAIALHALARRRAAVAGVRVAAR